MKNLWIPIALAAVLGAAQAASADARNGMFVSTLNPADNLFGFHVWGTDLYPRGLSLDNDTTSNPIWGLGLERGNGDLFINGYASGLTLFRMRGDTGQLEIGTGVGHPVSAVEVNVTAGTSQAPRAGLATNVYGDQFGLSLNQALGTTTRTKINFNNKFQLGTDINNANVADMFIADVTQQSGFRYPLTISAASSSTPDLVTLSYGATINGTATLNGPVSLLGATTTIGNSLQHTGNQLSFYGMPVVTQQTVTGCRSDGSALKSLLTALANLGLIKDQTTP